MCKQFGDGEVNASLENNLLFLWTGVLMSGEKSNGQAQWGISSGPGKTQTLLTPISFNFLQLLLPNK